MRTEEPCSCPLRKAEKLFPLPSGILLPGQHPAAAASGTGRGCYDANPACIMLAHKKDTRIPGVFYSVPARYSYSHHKKDAPKGVLA